MPESVTRVAYQAIADFSQLHMAANEAIVDLDRIKAKEAELNAASISGGDRIKAAAAARSKALQDETAAETVATGAVKAHEAATKADAAAENASIDAKKLGVKALQEAKKAAEDDTEAKKKNSSATKDLASDVGGLGRFLLNSVGNLFKHKTALDENTKSTLSFRSAWAKTMQDIDSGAAKTLDAASNGFDKLGAGLQKLLGAGNGRGGAAPFLLLFPLITGIIAVVNPAVAGLSAIGAAAIGLASNLGSLSGLVTALPAGILAYATSMGVLKESFKGVGTALSAWQAVQDGSGTLKSYQDALSKLTVPQQNFVKWLESMTGAWKNFKAVVTDNFFSQFQGDLEKLRPVFDVITNLMGQAAVAVGQVVDGLIKMASAPSFLNLLSVFGSENQTTIATFGKVLGDILDIFVKVGATAAPFVRDLDKSLGEMADHLDAIVSKSAGDGSLIKWLGDVYNNLHLWWGIVSDLAKTILNYGAAASGFGTWITEGLKKVTDGWLAASEAAMKPGSSFQKWLGDVKPLVSELAKTVGDLLHWWNQVSSNPDNITNMLAMLKDINDHLGPALGNLLQTMGSTKIGPDLIDLITSIVRMVDSLMSHGGAQVIESIIHFLTGVAGAVAAVVTIPGAATTLMSIATALGALSVLSFGNKFVPIFDLVSWLLKLVAGEGPITRVLDALSKTADKGGKVTKGGSTAAGEGAAAAGDGAAAVEEGATAAGEGAALGAEELGATAGKGGILGKIGGTASKLSKGGLGQIARMFALFNLGSDVAGAVTNPAPLGKNVNHFDISKNNWGDVGLGALNGAVAGSRLGPLGTIIGAGTGVASTAVGDNGRNVLSNILDPNSWARGAQQANNIVAPANQMIQASPLGNQNNWAHGAQQLNDFFAPSAKAWGNGAKQFDAGVTGIGNGNNWAHGAQQLNDFFAPANKALGHGADQISRGVQGIGNQKNWDNGAKQIGDAFGNGGKQINDFFAPVAKSFDNGGKQIEDFFTKKLPESAGHGAKQIGDFFSKTIPDAASHGGKQIGDFFTTTLPKAADHGGKQIGEFFTKTLPFAAGFAGEKISSTFKTTIPNAASHGAQQIGDFFTKTLPTSASHGAKQIGDAFSHGGKQINDTFKPVGDFFTKTLPTSAKHGASQINDSFSHGGKQINDFFKPVGDFFTKTLPTAGQHGAKQINEAFSSAGKNGSDSLKPIGDYFTKTLPTAAKHGGDQIWTALKDAGKWISDQASKFGKWLTGDLPNAFKHGGDQIWAAMKDAGKWLSDQASKFGKWLTVDLPGDFKRGGDQIWAALKTADKWLSDQGGKIWHWITVTVPNSLANGASQIWNSLPGIGGWISAQANALAGWLGGIGRQIGNAFNSGVAAAKNSAASAGQQFAGNPGHPGRHSGGPIFRAYGGGVPGWGDTDSVHAMLTPGEVVLRKSIVDAIGEQNLLDLNDGLMTYQQLLVKAMRSEPNAKNKASSTTFLGAGLAGSSASLSSLPSMGSGIGMSNSSSTSSIKNSGVSIANLNIINPTPERSTDSLPRTIRKVGYLTTARGR